jgi:predicted O-linked N-acetylglucosamine transferase (SPINDLY family)
MAQLTPQQAFDLAVAHFNAGRVLEAKNLCVQIIEVEPNHADAAHLLGVVARSQSHSAIAVECIRRALSFKNDWPDAHNNLGNALRDLHQLDEAIAAYRRAISLRGNDANFHYNLGNALREAGRGDEAIAAYDSAVLLNPGMGPAHYQLGIALREAIECYQMAIRLKPDFAAAWTNLGGTLTRNHEADQAIAALEKAIAIEPDLPQAHNNLGNALKATGRVDRAIGEFKKAVELKPDYDDAHSNLLLTLLYSPGWDPRAIAGEHRRWNSLRAEPLRRFFQGHTDDRDPGRRLRIGYVSPDFREHVVGRNLLPLFANHDHRRFEITCYSNVLCPDRMTARFEQLADRWRSIESLSDEQAANQIRDDRIDILVDLALHSAGNRLLVFARKPAPVQVTFAGYPGSTGLTAIDYRLSDPYLDPPGMDDAIHSEKTVRLPGSFWCYDPQIAGDIPVTALPALSGTGVTFGCLNNFCKVNDNVLALWAKVLGRVDHSRLLLLSPAGGHRLLVTQQFEREGINPARIEFVPQQSREKYLQTCRRIDLGLDTFPYNGHSTSLDLFWMGVPVVTLIGDRAAARAGWSLLSNLGMPELAAETSDQFVQIAVALANDLPRLNEIRLTLRDKMRLSPLMDAPRFARDIEAAYQQMWAVWCERIGS